MSDARRKARQLKIVAAGMRIAERLGHQDPGEAVSEIRIAALAAVAESRAVWAFLKDTGFATETQYQDYLDKGYDSVTAQVEGKAAEILVHG
jgi:hypothetical protein